MADDAGEIGHIDWEVDDGVAGIPLQVGVDHDTATIGNGETTWRLAAEQADELAALLITALWQAAAQGGGSSG